MSRLRVSRASIATACLVAAARVASAQSVATFEAGVIGVSSRVAPSTFGVTLTPAFRFDGARTALTVAGTAAKLDGGGWSGQALVAGSVFTPRVLGVRGELGLAADGLAYGGRGSGGVLSHARLHAHNAARGVWLGGGWGQTRYDAAWRPATTVGAGAWLRRGVVTATASLSRSNYAVSEALAPEPPGPDVVAAEVLTRDDALLGRVEQRGAFVDAAASFFWSRGALDLDLAAGVRDGALPSGSGGWGSVGGTYWLSRGIGLVFGLERYPGDPGQRIPAGTYGTIAVRFGARAPARRMAPAPVNAEPTSFVLRAEEAAGASSDTRSVRVRVPGARRVELMGDFTEWKPVALQPVGGDVWALAVRPVAPGTYRLSIRVDGGPWQAPPGLPAFTDEFSGEVAVLVIK